MLVLVRGEIWRTSKEISRSRVENQEILRTSRVKSANRTWARCWKASTFMHHCSNKIFLHCILLCEKAPGTRLDSVQQGCLGFLMPYSGLNLSKGFIIINNWHIGLVVNRNQVIVLITFAASCFVSQDYSSNAHWSPNRAQPLLQCRGIAWQWICPFCFVLLFWCSQARWKVSLRNYIIPL